MPLSQVLDEDWLVGPAGLRVSPVRRRAFVGDREITLTKTTFDVLELLLRRPGAVVTIDELVREVWGYENASRPGFARTAVYRLRKELKQAGVENVIEAVRGVGFRVADRGGRAEESPLPPELATFDPRDALMFAATAIFIVRDHRIVWANQAAQRLSGYTLAELEALPSTEALSGGGNPAAWERMKSRVAAGRTLHGPAMLRRKDGTELDQPASWKPVFDSVGRLQCSIIEFSPAAVEAAGAVDPTEVRQAG